MTSFESFKPGSWAAVNEYFALEGLSLSQRIADATLAVPRHEVVARYRYYGNADWYDVDATNLDRHLPAIYRDDGLGIAGVEGDDQVSTISRPSVVLVMLQMLSIQPGQRIFEVGTGSGWNAALMGHLANASGYVKTVEIVPALATRARGVIPRLGLKQVEVVRGDAADASSDGAFDRVIFTAGAYDIPDNIFDLVRVGGLLLMVLEFAGGGDAVILFRRNADHFESLTAKAYEVVAMTGRSRSSQFDPVLLEEFGPWRELPGSGQSPLSFS